MRNVWRSFQTFNARNKTYFSNHLTEVAETNMRTLWAALRVLIPFLLLYDIWTFVTIGNWVLFGCYGVLLAVLLALLLATIHFRRQKPNPKAVQAACVVCVCALMGFIIIISIFPFPDDPAIFYSLCYIIVAALFTFPYKHIALLMSAITAVYLILVELFRPQEVVYLDHFCAVTTWIATSIFLLLITDLRLRNGEAMELLETASRTDSLTGLPNRRNVQTLMPASFTRCQQMGLQVAAIMVDVDHFKEYNDSFGHEAGDQCLRAIGQILQEFSQQHGALAARYGGEEFLLVLENAPLEEVHQLSQELLGRVREAAIPAPQGIVSISLGVAVQTPGKGDTLPALIQQADEALYRSKEAGRNRATLLQGDGKP